MIRQDLSLVDSDQMAKLGQEIAEKSEERIGNIINHFIKESGKYLVISTALMVMFFSWTGQARSEDVLTFMIMLTFLFFGMFALYQFNHFSKQTAERDKQFQQFVDDAKSLIDDRTKRLIGRIDGLESAAPWGIFELSLPKGEIIHVNKKFVELTGYDLDRLSNLMPGGIPDLVSFSHRDDFLENLRNLLARDIKGFSQDLRVVIPENEWTFPAQINAQIIKENGSHIVQGFVFDRSMEESFQVMIKAQNDIVNTLLGQFDLARREKEIMEDIQGQLSHIKEALKNA